MSQIEVHRQNRQIEIQDQKDIDRQKKIRVSQRKSERGKLEDFERREREQRARQKETDRERDRKREIEREGEREKDRQIDREIVCERGESIFQRERDSERKRERKRDSERKRRIDQVRE